MADQTTTIPKGWKMTTLGEVADIKGGKRLPMGKSLVTQRTKHPYIRITDIENNKIKKDQLQFVPDDVFSSISRYIVNSGDVIVSIVGSIGFVAKIDDDLDNASLTENCVKFVNLKNLDSKYLYYFLTSKSGQDEIERNTVGAVQKKLPIYGVQNIQIPSPLITEQRAIAAVLSSLDDKIELLREQNKTLEATAQAIFKEWFVNFNFPGATGKMIGSELGDLPAEASAQAGIPEEWRVGTVNDFIKRETISYRCDQDDLSVKGKTPIIDQGTNGLYGYTEREPDFHASKDNPVILFTNHTCNMWFVNYPFCAIQNVIPFRGNTEYSTFFVFYMTLGKVKFIEYKGHWPDFEQKKHIIPKPEIANQFAEFVKPLQYKIWNNNYQVETLSKLRDTLLPKLMKGDVRVKGFKD